MVTHTKTNKAMTENKELLDELGAVIEKFRTERSLMTKSLRKGERMRRTPFDTLEEMGLATAEPMLEEYARISDKKSTLSAAPRRMVALFVEQAVRMIIARNMKKPKKRTANKRAKTPAQAKAKTPAKKTTKTTAKKTTKTDGKKVSAKA